MKKNITKIFVGIISMFACIMLSSCKLFEAVSPDKFSFWSNDWCLKNNTDSKLFYRFDDDYIQALFPDEIKVVYYKEIPDSGEKKDFNAFFEERNYQTLKIYLDMNGEPVKVWSKEEANSHGKQFWNERSWISVELTKPENSESASWVFEITSDDLK